MKIDVLPRRFFEHIKGTAEEREILATTRVISINSHDEEPPFSQEAKNSPNLLCLFFDDIVEPDGVTGVLFSEADAQAILDFVCDDSMPVIVHCSAGIARSGAVGEALDLYYNQWRSDNTDDHKYFLDNNRQIMPNTIVKRLLMRVIYKKDENS